MKRLLLVTYYFPPLGGPGVFRPLRLCKYLPREGWEVTVLTVSDRIRALKDASLAAEVPAGLRVERTRSLEPRVAFIALGRLGLGGLVRRIEPWLMLPDDQLGWVAPATRRAQRLLQQVPHDAVLTTSSPFSAHLVGSRLARRTGIPWVADFRDEWTTNPYLADRYPTRWHRRLNQRLERRVLGEADRVVCVSRPWLDALRSRLPSAPDGKFVVLPNGYDGAHFPDPTPEPPARFRIVYTGMFYGARSPAPFLEALRRVATGGRIPADEIEVLFMGHTGWSGGALRAPAGVQLRIVEQRPYFEALAMLRQAAVLLLVVPPEGGAGNHTGKLFPYLASGRPILALAPRPNVAADLILASRSGVVAPPDDPAAIARAIEELYQRWRRGDRLADQDRELIRQYEAGPQARDWARLLDATRHARRS